MLINIVYEKCENAELLEKMKNISNNEEWDNLVREYGFSECMDAFGALYGDYEFSDVLYERMWDTLYSEMADELEYVIEWIKERRAQ